MILGAIMLTILGLIGWYFYPGTTYCDDECIKSQDKNVKGWVNIESSRFSAGTIQEMRGTSSPTECMAHCEKNPKCVSINYKP